jgi:ribosomal protein S18 acetylase RimI-like enzyme
LGKLFYLSVAKFAAMSVTIRLADTKDAEIIADLSQRTFRDTFAQFNTPENMDMFMNEQFTKKALMEEVALPGNIFLLAFLDDEAVGYVRMRESKNPDELGNSKAIEIARIYSEQRTIGKGVGKALMLKCLEMAKEMNKEMIWLGVWEHNPTAIGFYEKFGFEKFGSHPFLLGEDKQTDFLFKRKIG